MKVQTEAEKIQEYKKSYKGFMTEAFILLGEMGKVNTPLNPQWKGIFTAAFQNCLLPIGVQIEKAPIFYAPNGSLEISLEVLSTTIDEIAGGPNVLLYPLMDMMSQERFKAFFTTQVDLNDKNYNLVLSRVLTMSLVISVMNTIDIATDAIVMQMQYDQVEGRPALEMGLPFPVANFPYAEVEEIGWEYMVFFEDLLHPDKNDKTSDNPIGFGEELDEFPAFDPFSQEMAQVRINILNWAKENLPELHYNCVKQAYGD
jgi:hypothetical protein